MKKNIIWTLDFSNFEWRCFESTNFQFKMSILSFAFPIEVSLKLWGIKDWTQFTLFQHKNSGGYRIMKHIVPPKVEKILKGSLDSIPSPSSSVKIQIIGGNWGNKAKHWWMISANFLFSKVCSQSPAMFCLYISSKHYCP